MHDQGPAARANRQDAAFSPDGLSLVLRFPVHLPALAWAQEHAAAFLRERKVGGRVIGRAELLLEELATNVISHGAVTDPAAGFAVTLTLEPDGGCGIVFEDPGLPFDSAAATLPDRPARLEEARVGGLGLVLLRKMARDLRHVALPGGGNRVSFRLDGAG